MHLRRPAKPYQARPRVLMPPQKRLAQHSTSAHPSQCALRPPTTPTFLPPTRTHACAATPFPRARAARVLDALGTRFLYPPPTHTHTPHPDRRRPSCRPSASALALCVGAPGLYLLHVAAHCVPGQPLLQGLLRIQRIHLWGASTERHMHTHAHVTCGTWEAGHDDEQCCSSMHRQAHGLGQLRALCHTRTSARHRVERQGKARLAVASLTRLGRQAHHEGARGCRVGCRVGYDAINLIQLKL